MPGTTRPHLHKRLRWLILLAFSAGCGGDPLNLQPPDDASGSGGAPQTVSAPFHTSQPSGTTIELRRVGGEALGVYQDAQGYTVLCDSGAYKYAAPAGDGALVATDHLVGRSEPSALGLRKGLSPSAVMVAEAEALARSDFVVQTPAEQVPQGFGIIGGDMIVPLVGSAAGHDRGPRGAYHATRHWPDGVVPYEFDPAVSGANQAAMRDSMDAWEAVASVSFVPRNGEAAHVYIQNSSGNSAYLGYYGDIRHYVNIYNWNYKFIMCHELAHILSVWHEQSRPDRDGIVQINWENITAGKEHNFDRHDDALTSGTHDLDSVMHYPRRAFTSNGSDTITVLAPNEAWQDLIGQRSHLSVGDIGTMVDIYGSPNPIAVAAFVATDEDTPVGGTLEASDPGELPLAYSIFANADFGTAVVTDADAGTYTYTPDPGSNGEIDTFSFKASNGSTESQPGVVTVGIFDGLISPAAGFELTTTSQSFMWKEVAGATSYRLRVGDSAGAAEYLDFTTASDQQKLVTGLPSDGRALHVRLSAEVGAAWQDNDFAYSAYSALAKMTSPAGGSTLGGADVDIQWSAGTGVSQYWLWVGNAAGGYDLYNADAGTNLSATVSGLPLDGRTLYVRLHSELGGEWYANDYTFTAATVASAAAELTSHTDGDTLSGSSENFAWSAGTDVAQYYIYIGTTQGGYDIKLSDQGLNRSATIDGLPTDGSTLYFRMYSLIAGQWESNDYTFTAASGGGGGGAAAELTSHADDDTLSGSSENFAWSAGTGVTEYYTYIGTTQGGYEIHLGDQGLNRSATIDGLPADGSTLYFRMYSLIAGQWEFNDYTFTAAGGGGGGGGGPAAELTSHTDGDTLSGSSESFAWSAGTGVTQYYIYIGSGQGGYDLHLGDQGLSRSATIDGLPADGSTLYFRMYSLIAGQWEFNDYTFTAAGGGGGAAPAELTSHTDGDTLSGASESFSWSAGTGVTQYYIYIGSSQGDYDIYLADFGLDRSATIDNLPADGSTLYFRLYSKIAGQWEYSDYDFQAAGP